MNTNHRLFGVSLAIASAVLLFNVVSGRVSAQTGAPAAAPTTAGTVSGGALAEVTKRPKPSV